MQNIMSKKGMNLCMLISTPLDANKRGQDFLHYKFYFSQTGIFLINNHSNSFSDFATPRIALRLPIPSVLHACLLSFSPYCQQPSVPNENFHWGSTDYEFDYAAAKARRREIKKGKKSGAAGVFNLTL